MRITVGGAGGFLGGWATKRLVEQGHEVWAVDIKPCSEWFQIIPGAKVIRGRVDLGIYEECLEYVEGSERVYNFAANMGGMLWIAYHDVECLGSVLATTNMLRAAAETGVRQFLYTSSACAYPAFLQEVEKVSLKEEDAFPALPAEGYGWEKLFGEILASSYRRETGMETFIPRLHNIFGPKGTIRGGREKAPAAICRKVAEAVLTGDHVIDIWGDGHQVRSFLYVDECLEGFDRIIESGYGDPINLGSDESVSINQLVTMVEEIAGVTLERRYQMDMPQGVRGRNSDNMLIREVTGWAPSASLRDGLVKTYEWIFQEVKRDLGL